MLRRAEERLHRPRIGGRQPLRRRDGYWQLTKLYRAVQFYIKDFQPSMKLRTKQREGSKVTRRYHDARTPLQRLADSSALPDDVRDRLLALFAALDP